MRKTDQVIAYVTQHPGQTTMQIAAGMGITRDQAHGLLRHAKTTRSVLSTAVRVVQNGQPCTALRWWPGDTPRPVRRNGAIQTTILQHLHEAALTLTELARRIQWPQDRTRHVLGTMEREGLIERLTGPDGTAWSVVEPWEPPKWQHPYAKPRTARTTAKAR